MFRATVLIVIAALCTDTSAMPPAEAFGALPSIHDAAISPDGRQIAAIVNFNGTYGIRVLTIGAKDEDLRAILLG